MSQDVTRIPANFVGRTWLTMLINGQWMRLAYFVGFCSFIKWIIGSNMNIIQARVYWIITYGSYLDITLAEVIFFNASGSDFDIPSTRVSVGRVLCIQNRHSLRPTTVAVPMIVLSSFGYCVVCSCCLSLPLLPPNVLPLQWPPSPPLPLQSHVHICLVHRALGYRAPQTLSPRVVQFSDVIDSRSEI